jgi:aspartate/methionine/tyrosine aminotransferase
MVYPQRLHEPMLKIQDTLPTHASTSSQQVALAAFGMLGTEWVREQVATLQPVRSVIWDAVQPLFKSTESRPEVLRSLSSPTEIGPERLAESLPEQSTESWPERLTESRPEGSSRSLTQPRGAFYYLLPLPPGVSEDAAVSLLAREYGLLVLPGRAFGAPGHLRLSYGGLAEKGVAVEVADRLRKGVEHLCRLRVD